MSGAFFKSGAQLTLSLEPGGQVATVIAASNGSFSTTLTAPAAAGSYTLSAVGFEPDGSVTNGLPARASFTVGAIDSPAPVAPPAPAEAPASATPGAVTTPGASQPPATRPARERAARPQTRPRTRAFSKPRAEVRGGRPRALDRSRALADAGAVGAGGGLVDGSSGAVFAASVTRRARVAPDERARIGRATPSERSAAGDVWAGFNSADAPSLLARKGEGAPGGGAGAQLGWGIGMLSVGLLALTSGLATSAARRRRRRRAR